MLVIYITLGTCAYLLIESVGYRLWFDEIFRNFSTYTFTLYIRAPNASANFI